MQSTLRKALPFWGGHLLFVFLGLFVAAATSFFPNRAGIEVELSIALSVVYFVAFIVLSRRTADGAAGGLISAAVTVLPLLLLVGLAAVYGYYNPADTIGSTLLTYPVILPFLPWVNEIHPAVHFHLMRFLVILIPWAAIVIGSLFPRSKTGSSPSS